MPATMMLLGICSLGFVVGILPPYRVWLFQLKAILYSATMLCVGFYIWRLARLRRRPYVGFTPDGVVVNRSGKRRELIVVPWQRLRDSGALHDRHGIMYWLQEELKVGVEQRLWPEVEAAARKRIEAISA